MLCFNLYDLLPVGGIFLRKMVPVHFERFKPFSRRDESMSPEAVVERIDRLHQTVEVRAARRIEQLGLHAALRP